MVDTHILGTNVSVEDGALKAGLLSLTQMVDLTSFQNMEFIRAASLKNSTVLDVHREFQKIYPGGIFNSSEGGMVPDSSDNVFEKYIHLTKKRASYKITDESKIRRDITTQIKNAIVRITESFAQQRDDDILANIVKGYGVTTNASAKWDTGGCDPLGDIGTLFDTLFDKDDVSVKENDIGNMVIFYPLKLYSKIRDPVRLTTASGQVASNIRVNSTDLEWSGNEYGVTWIGSTKLNYLGNVYAVIPTPDKTLDHYTYNGPEIKGVESDRDIYAGTDTVVYSRYFGSMIVPESETQKDSNYRIMRIATVCDPSTVTL